jgi:hypothetical protein
LPSRKTSGKSPQAQRSKSIQPLSSAALKEQRKRLNALAKQLERGIAQTPAEKNRLKNKQAKERLAELRKYGLYEPTGKELTPTRFKTINRKWNELQELLRTGIYAPYPSRAPKVRKEIQRAARDARNAPEGQAQRVKITKKGIFLGRDQREMKTSESGTLFFDAELGIWEIKAVRKMKDKRTGQIINRTQYRALAGPEALILKQQMIRDKFARMNLKPNEAVRFKIGNTSAFSRQAFTSIDRLFRHVNGYRKSDPARANFMQDLSIIRFSKSEPDDFTYSALRDGFKVRPRQGKLDLEDARERWETLLAKRVHEAEERRENARKRRAADQRARQRRRAKKPT